MGNHKGSLRAALVLLLIGSLSGFLYGQVAPPTKIIKKRHGQSATLSWGYTSVPDFDLRYFSVKATYDLNIVPVEIAQAASTARSATIPVVFTSQYPKYVYFVVTAFHDGSKGRVESFNSNTVGAERIGPPPH